MDGRNIGTKIGYTYVQKSGMIVAYISGNYDSTIKSHLKWI